MRHHWDTSLYLRGSKLSLLNCCRERECERKRKPTQRKRGSDKDRALPSQRAFRCSGRASPPLCCALQCTLGLSRPGGLLLKWSKGGQITAGFNTNSLLHPLLKSHFRKLRPACTVSKGQTLLAEHKAKGGEELSDAVCWALAIPSVHYWVPQDTLEMQRTPEAGPGSEEWMDWVWEDLKDKAEMCHLPVSSLCLQETLRNTSSSFAVPA